MKIWTKTIILYIDHVMINICNEIYKSASGSKVNGGETLLSCVHMMRPDTHPAYQGGDGPSKPIVDVESQEAAH